MPCGAADRDCHRFQRTDGHVGSLGPARPEGAGEAGAVAAAGGTHGDCGRWKKKNGSSLGLLKQKFDPNKKSDHS